jgi:hypothetical protein
MRKMFLLTIIVSLFCLGNKSAGANDLFVQPAELSDAVEVSIEMNDWILEMSTGNVDLYYQIGECDGQKVIFMKFENRNNHEVEITWKETVHDNFSKSHITGFYGEKQLVLAPGQLVQADCTSSICQECITRSVDVTPTHLVEIKEFSFTEVSVSTR